jgi:ATP-dependent exoDNAse (exonuclease V) beta subunit
MTYFDSHAHYFDERFVRETDGGPDALLDELLSGKRIYRELRFHSMLPAALFTEDDSLRAKLSEKSILVQGVIDCLYESRSGELVLVDYKTDRIDRRTDRELAKKQLIHRHREQLFYYTLAISKMFGRKPDRILLYSLCLSDIAEFDPNEMAFGD